ncbi:unnamed protein product [Arabidopsis arenosa]|uniref:DUF4057 domain-containing protein n=2 Tax=Arabidopsis TaxID=3701 RepID=A0A8T1YES1_ARASU|nr:uncharacterized protein LOC9305005 isoform X2 [Arabidopsis lyrata subsp. lyrata]KAG7544610.1 hypothetical protein ISN44_As12g001850 [Arabidopsis suecica]CAE6152555.1 unnamed protein product [Arabidopsis arenosa]|eukprot:XP_020872228.1 uncharacterized protein LOC9305005 isoform X2 [Arabidopsis lyrata subsp. lyrata]
MERNTPVRNPHTSTADLLSWSETPPPHHSTSSAARSHQPSDGISKILGGGQITDEEAQSLNKLKNCSGYKLKEMTGSGIFNDKGKVGSESDATDPKTGLRYYQTLNGMSQISFSADGNVSPKKPTTLTEVAKQRELSGNLLTEADLKSNKQISSAKIEEISGHDIFGPPSEIQPRSLVAAQQEARGNRDMGEPAPRNLRTSVKVSNPAGGQSNILFSEEPVVKTSKKIHNQKFQELTGNGIFKGDESPGTADKQLSSAKLREMSGNNIFADGKSESRDYFGGVRKPPGGESSISLV